MRARARRLSVLILCEGSKTEPNYLSAVIRDLGLTAVSVPRNHNTDPLGLGREAIGALNKDKSLYRAFVVFDRDDHQHFAQAVHLAQQNANFGGRLLIARSYPSFELWLLQHFERCRAPLSCDEALARLRAAYPAYQKGNAICMDEFVNRIPTAIQNAAHGLADAVATGEMNSSTEMHLLIAELQSLAARQ